VGSTGVRETNVTEDYFLACRVWAVVAWLVMAVLMGAAWLVMTLDAGGWKVAALLAACACATSAVAATLHVRSFMVRVCALIRAASTARGVQLEQKGLRPIP
jgi:hypothetical protein